MHFLKSNRWFFILCFFFITLLLTGLSGCSGNSSDSDANLTSAKGDVMIGITDAAGDFAAYTVDIVSLKLNKKNGAVVDTLPLSSRVDFAQYVDLTEFFTIQTIPAGQYDTVTMTLDYQNADIQVETDGGEVVPVETILDENGNGITLLTVTVDLVDNKPLIIVPGTPAYLMLDFDLSASNTIDFDINENPVLTVDPTLLADISPEEPKPHRIRGPLKDVNMEDDCFHIIVRPFLHSLSHNNSPFGTLTVLTDDDTSYDINGQVLQGKDGLAALSNLAPFSAVVAMGDLKFRPYRFLATEVTAGSSVTGGDQDSATGNVVSREGNVLTLKGTSLKRANGSVVFNDNLSVILGENTKIRREMSEEEYTADDISIGQRILVFGALSENGESGPAIDASEGTVTLILTTIRGTVLETDDLSADETPLVIDLQSISNRDANVFDFDVTDADPKNYEIFTGQLDISSLSQGDPIRILGYVSPFEENPPDFEAHTIVNVGTVKSILKIHWRPATANALSNISTDGLTLDLNGVGLFHHVNQGLVITDLSTLQDPPLIGPAEDKSGYFSIHARGPKSLYTNFDDFIADLSDRIADGAQVKKINAFGNFDESTATMTADTIKIHLF